MGTLHYKSICCHKNYDTSCIFCVVGPWARHINLIGPRIVHVTFGDGSMAEVRLDGDGWRQKPLEDNSSG